MARSYELQSLESLCNAHVLSFSVSPVFAPPTSKTWFPDCSQAGRSPGVISGCVDPKIDLQTSLALFLSPTCLLCMHSDFCCGYLPSQTCIRHLKRLLHGYGAELCGPGSNGWEVSFCYNRFDRSRLDLSGDCSSSISQTHFQLLHRWNQNSLLPCGCCILDSRPPMAM